ncbi:sensor histidine kinase [Bacillus sp. SB49]|uniref:ATP-binding protein n=1 Tax=Bacillus sp. SB49 TaxID=1071080 RepID=UPI0003FA3336|nr:sensor histidine kinase [Bacillus sp. SB49]QHT47731.1 sensor histidine kinase [Bacillus sp. SB49]
MPVKQMPIRWKITILSFGIVLFSILIGGIVIIGNAVESQEESLGERSLMTGRTVANLPAIEDGLRESEGWKVINPIVEQIRMVNQADYIVVLNMNRIRYSHPMVSKLGTASAGKDEGPAFAEHSYVSKAKGDSGIAVRGFVPVMNENHEQIGVVIVGNLLPSWFDILGAVKGEILFVLLLTLSFGIVGSWMLARHLKEGTYRLEPHEIVQLLVERTATFQAMNEGIIAIDKEGRITIMNEKAKAILSLQGDFLNQHWKRVIPDVGIIHSLVTGEQVRNKEVRMDQTVILSTSIPIRIEEEIVGAVMVFQDRTEVKELAEELTGVKAFVDALRIQNHEHLNKLHTIAGLIQLDKREEALDFVFDTSENQERLSGFLMQRFPHYSIAGLLLSKISRGLELGIEVTLDDYSEMHVFPPLLDQHDFVIIIGNLIENAFQSFDGIYKEQKWLDISVIQGRCSCVISVEDNGRGMTEEERIRMFDKGFTTKETGSGIGLFLVKQIVEKGRGDWEVVTKPGEGTSVLLTIPMEGEVS